MLRILRHSEALRESLFTQGTPGTSAENTGECSPFPRSLLSCNTQPLRGSRTKGYSKEGGFPGSHFPGRSFLEGGISLGASEG